MDSITVKRIYEPSDASDGRRILVDRVWPRGISKEKANIEEWMKEAAPSTNLRKWFNHIPERFEEFKDKYLQELRNDPQKSELVDDLCILASGQKVTLLFSAKDARHNQAVVLMEEVESRLKNKKGSITENN